MLKKIIIIILLLAIVFLGYNYFKKEDITETKQTEKTKPAEFEEQEVLTNITRETAQINDGYFEEIVAINTQPMYYAYPKKIDEENPPKLIIYSHGQLQRVVEDFEDEYMLKLREYGDFFTKHNYVFSASNQHDDNWGEKESLSDISNSINWFEENKLPIAENIYMIGFSMGGRATINYAIKDPSNIKAITLLAPTPRANLSYDDVTKIKDIRIAIWHGTADVNIPITTSRQYVNQFRNNNKEVKLFEIEEKGHFEIETSLMNEILEFFEN